MFRPSMTGKLCTLILIGMTLLVFAGPVIEYINGDVQYFLGWINNHVLFIVLICAALIPPLSLSMRSPGEIGVIGVFVLLAVVMTSMTAARTEAPLFSLGGLFVLAGGFGGGLLFHVAARDGAITENRIIAIMLATTPALILPFILISIAPDVQENFKFDVYGYSNVRAVGYFTSAVIALSFGLLATRRPGPKRAAIGMSCTLVATAVLFWSGSRGGLVALMVGLAIVLAIAPRRSWRGVAMFVLAGALGAALSTTMFKPTPQYGIIDRVARDIDKVQDAGNKGAGADDMLRRVSSNRIEMWQWAIGKTLDSPWTGYGYLPMPWMDEERFDYHHTHNIVVEYWLGFGFPTGTLLITLGVIAWVAAIRATRRIATPAATGFASFITVMAVYANMSATLFFPFHLVATLALTGFLIGRGAFVRKQSASAGSPRPAHDDTFRPDIAWMV